MIDRLQLVDQRLAGLAGFVLQRTPLIEGFGKPDMYRGQALVEGAEEGAGGFTLLTGAFDDELDHLQAGFRQQGRVDPDQQLAANVAQALADGAGKVEFGDKPLQLISDASVIL